MFNYLLDLASVGGQVHDILKEWVGPLFIMIGACGGIWSVVMGVQYARCENDAKRAELKSRMVNCIIGVVIIWILAIACLCINWGEIVKIFGYIWEDGDSSGDGGKNGGESTWDPNRRDQANIGMTILKLGVKAIRGIVIN